MNDIVTTMNSDKVLCGSFDLYPSYAADILNSVREIHIYVLSCEKIITRIILKNVLPVKSTVVLINHID